LSARQYARSLSLSQLFKFAEPLLTKVLPNLDQTFIMALAILLTNPPKIFATAKQCDPPKVKTRCQQIVAA
jgi:hypothetical protein